MAHMRVIGPLVYGNDYLAVVQYMQRKNLLASMHSNLQQVWQHDGFPETALCDRRIHMALSR